MALGGKRPGAGRKPGAGTLESQKARTYIAERIAEIMPQVFEVLWKKAKAGDMTAMKELLDRGFGKAPQSMALDMKGDISVVFDDAFKDSK